MAVDAESRNGDEDSERNASQQGSWKRWAKSVMRWVAPLLLFYLGVALLLQREMVFVGKRRPAPQKGVPPGAQRVMLGADKENQTEAWFLPPTHQSVGPSAALIFAHGNGELIHDYTAASFAPLRSWGAAVMLVEYPGYGHSGGWPSEESLQLAMVAAYDWLAAREDIEATRVVGMGRSLGGGAVCSLSRQRPLAALVLLSTFTSLRDISPRFGLPGFLVRDPFDNEAAVAEFNRPVFIAHGKDDKLIPIELAGRLAKAAGSEVWEQNGHHNDCPVPWPQLRQFLQRAEVLR